MKKTFLYLALASVAIVSCRKDDTIETAPEVSIETQNTYDDQAAQVFLNTHTFDAKGNLLDYKEGDTAHVKLADLVPAPVILPSGVIYVVKQSAQPDPGTAIGSNDIIQFMGKSISYVAISTDGKVSFTSASQLINTIDGNGNPEIDPPFYYVKNSVLKALNDKNNTSFDHSYYEIEGFREALQKFKAFDIPVESNYSLQGVIIVPSRLAYARDPHFNYTGVSFRNRSFVFNFQIYNTKVRNLATED